jgi:hypothetical protein
VFQSATAAELGCPAASECFKVQPQLSLAADTELDEERLWRNGRALFLALGNAQRYLDIKIK